MGLSPSSSPSSALPPDLFDTTTLLSLGFTVIIVLFAYLTSLYFLPSTTTTSSHTSTKKPSSSARAVNVTTTSYRFLFCWHLADALCHFLLEGSFLYHCFFSWVPSSHASARSMVPGTFGYLGWGGERVYGAQAAPTSPTAMLWMVYARADRRWAGADLGVISLELLTVFFDGPLALYICYCMVKRDPKAYIWMIVLATCELYGGFMTFCPEWLIGSSNLDTSNFMYLWVYLVFFNMLWVFIPLYATWYAVGEISNAFRLAGNKKIQ